MVLPCTGDPYRYPQAAGPDGKAFFENDADVTDVVFYDRECARLVGKVWVPKSASDTRTVPTIVITNGYVQAPGAAPWPGLLDDENPVDVAVAWDSLITPEGEGLTTATNLQLPPPLYDVLLLAVTQGTLPDFAPRVPAMSIFADYGFAPLPYPVPPDSQGGKVAFNAWRAAGIPAYTVGFQGTTHFDFSLLPLFPASSRCPDVNNGSCAGGWGRPSITYYTVAWFDRWLKQPGDQGYEDADIRLTDDARLGSADRMSFQPAG